MKKIFIITIIFLGLYNVAFSQWEFQYFVLKVGVNHQMYSNQPDTLNNFYINTPEGEMRAFPSEKFLDYVPGINAALHFHLDFQNDNGGLVAGIEYFNFGFSSKYNNFNAEYSLISTKRIHGVGLPLMLKFGREIFNDQKYFFGGVQYNINLSLQTTETLNIYTESKNTWAKDIQFLKSQPIFCVGFNYMIFNIELDYMPKNFLNSEYTYNAGTSDFPAMIRPYSGQPKNLFFLKTSLNVPLSPWTTKKNYTLHKIVKRLKFWR